MSKTENNVTAIGSKKPLSKPSSLSRRFDSCSKWIVSMKLFRLYGLMYRAFREVFSCMGSS